MYITMLMVCSFRDSRCEKCMCCFRNLKNNSMSHLSLYILATSKAVTSSILVIRYISSPVAFILQMTNRNGTSMVFLKLDDMRWMSRSSLISTVSFSLHCGTEKVRVWHASNAVLFFNLPTKLM